MANIHSNISFALVSIPVLINPIIKNNDTSFNQIHKKCNHRVKYIKYCPYCKKDIKENEIIKGYKIDNDDYLIFTKEELNKLKPDNMGEIEIVSFINDDEVDPYFYEKSYILEPEKKSKAYFLFCEALKKTKRIALAKTILNNKFYYCVLRFNNYGIVMNTLFFNEEVNIPDEKINLDVNEKELNLAIKLIESLKGKFEPEKYRDEYQDLIKDAIDKKSNGEKIKGVKKKTKKQVTDIMEALEKSLRTKK